MRTRLADSDLRPGYDRPLRPGEAPAFHPRTGELVKRDLDACACGDLHCVGEVCPKAMRLVEEAARRDAAAFVPPGIIYMDTPSGDPARVARAVRDTIAEARRYPRGFIHLLSED